MLLLCTYELCNDIILPRENSLAIEAFSAYYLYNPLKLNIHNKRSQKIDMARKFIGALKYA